MLLLSEADLKSRKEGVIQNSLRKKEKEGKKKREKQAGDRRPPLG